MSSEMFDLFFSSFGETLLMVAISGLLGALLGVPLGIALHLTDRNGVLPHTAFNRVVGVIVVYAVLAQKERFISVDYDLFKMMGAHAATALTSAMLFTDCEGKLPGLEAFRDLEEPRVAPRDGGES